ncbi:MAG: ABC transporter permease [Eggerthellaceae bacterium]|nr:ABC transporter permease [Eggerthellaceae bacterium]
MKQFKTIMNFELMNFFKNKIFIGITVFLMLLVAIVLFIPRIVDATSQGEEPTPIDPNDLPVVIVTAPNDVMGLVLQDVLQQAFEGSYRVEFTHDDAQSIETLITLGAASRAFAFEDWTVYTYYVKNISISDYATAVVDGVIQNLYRLNSMVSAGMTPEQAQEIMSIAPTHETINLGVDQTNNFLYTYIMVIALFMIIMLYGQMVASNVASEKSTRAMELLVTSAKPISMMFGKVLAACAAGLVQIALIFGSAIVFYRLNESYWASDEIISSLFNIPPELLIYMLVFFLLGFLLYAFMYGAIGSTASKLEDINTAVMPITFIFIIAYILVIFSLASGSVDNVGMVIFSYVPFTSPMAMFARLAMSVVAWWEIAISIGILVATVVTVGILAARIYRAGVLLYGTKPTFKEMFKMLRN